MALVRVYCGLASADDSVRAAPTAQLTIAVVDDAGRLLGVHEISDDPGGYAELGMLLVERTSGFTDAAVAADSDDHLVTSLLIAAGRPLVVTDDDATDDFAERFADDDSIEEMQAPPAARRAVGLARALQAGAIAAVTQATPRELVSYKPVLAAHVALLTGRSAAAGALREVLRELYPAALRAYPDPAHALALAVLDALPEPGRLTSQGAEPQQVAEQVAVELIRAGAGTDDEIISAVTALQVAISESPRRGGVNKSLAPAAAETVRQAIAAVRACDAACASLIGTIAARSVPATRRADPAAAAARSGPAAAAGRRSRREPTSTGVGAIPQPMNAPPVAPDPVAPPPLAPRPVAPPPAAPAAATVFPNRSPIPSNRPVSVPPPPPGMTPITPGSRPSPAAAPSSPAASRPPAMPPSSLPAASLPGGSFPPASVSPADSGQPFRATLTNAAINSARAERQRTVVPPRPSRAPSSPAPGSATDYSLPMPTQRPEPTEPGSRANWPLINPGGDEAASPAASISAPPTSTGRVKPPWQDMPKEPPALRLVEPQLSGGLDATLTGGLPPINEPPSLRVVDGERSRISGRRGGSAPSTTSTKLTALDRSTTPPVAADGNDTDLLIFAAARSAWFTGHSDTSADLDWANPNDSGWRAAQRAATPEIAAETSAGLPKRVPQANLVPGSPLRDERPLRIVRDAASIAAHTTGYFRGWRRGQEIGGFAMGGRPGRESAGGWDFTRDREGADDYRNNANYSSR
ncbi:transposase [Actinoplanes sp. KI2]|uniref:transposase n=1 Tax=Actinoplanes sp. KI2 TaxID=2983315 RepID=UPI0021D600FD|nr:transposase [Actinoplanes sp. KI2]MCU7726735.1 transposase [Actinoplanes sp. KI2]